ncbi:hypothetical protein KY289_013848 [Solanum tuberosum]|nr:hypothetical protein KY289_013848 [Solanum tuberosum]
MDALNFPNPQMVVDGNYKLRNWWIDIKRDREREIRHLFGRLTYLIFVIPNPHLIKVLLKFWDPVRMVFKFVDFDLAPTIDEISGLIDLLYHECEMMALYTREHYIWILKEVNDRELSGEGYYGLTDEMENIWARNTMVYHTQSKDALPSLPNENRKGMRKAINEKVISKTIEKKHPSDELVSGLEKKIRELEKEVSDMRGWARLLLSVDPTLETNIDKPSVKSQATLQDNPPPTHPTSQNQLSSIQMPPKNTHFPNYPYPPQHYAYASKPPCLTLRLPSPTLQTHQYQTHLHPVPWYP